MPPGARPDAASSIRLAPARPFGRTESRRRRSPRCAPDQTAARRARIDFGRHLLFRAALERVFLRPRLHSEQEQRAKDSGVAILTALVTDDVYQWGALMAGSLFGLLPIAILYSLFVDYYVSSLTGAIKQ